MEGFNRGMKRKPSNKDNERRKEWTTWKTGQKVGLCDAQVQNYRTIIHLLNARIYIFLTRTDFYLKLYEAGIISSWNISSSQVYKKKIPETTAFGIVLYSRHNTRQEKSGSSLQLNERSFFFLLHSQKFLPSICPSAVFLHSNFFAKQKSLVFLLKPVIKLRVWVEPGNEIRGFSVKGLIFSAVS